MLWAAIILMLAAVAPIWAFEYFPSQDGPSHVYNAHVLLHLDDAPYSRVYTADWSPVPNMLGTALLVGLGALVGVGIAEKLLLTLIVVGFSAGFLWLVRGDQKRAPPLALLGPMLAFNYPLHMGFYSFCLGMALVPWAWEASRRQHAIAVGALAVVAWFAHLVPALLILVGGVVFHPRRSWTLLPAVGLVIWYATGFSGGDSVRWPLGKLIDVLISLRVTASYVGAQEWLGMGIAVALAGLIGWRLRMGEIDARWLIIAAAALVLYLALPDGSAGHWFLSERLSLAPWLALAPLAVVDRFPRTQLTVFACVTLGSLAATLPHTENINAELADYTSMATEVETGSTLLPLAFDNPDDPRFERARVFMHPAGWYGVRRSAVDAGNYEAQTDHFQTRLAKYAAFPNHDQVAAAPQDVDLARYRSRVGYILVRNPDNAPPDFIRAIERGYDPIADKGPTRLFRRRSDAPQ